MTESSNLLARGEQTLVVPRNLSDLDIGHSYLVVPTYSVDYLLLRVSSSETTVGQYLFGPWQFGDAVSFVLLPI
jgi:hypothetical protein